MVVVLWILFLVDETGRFFCCFSWINDKCIDEPLHYLGFHSFFVLFCFLFDLGWAEKWHCFKSCIIWFFCSTMNDEMNHMENKKYGYAEHIWGKSCILHNLIILVPNLLIRRSDIPNLFLTNTTKCIVN